jgi:anti-sigma regulatory factor (Ser/Thr protein kinase)
VDEACSNAIRHAYAGRADGRLDLELCGDDKAIRIVLTDEGTPAEPGRVARQKVSRPSVRTVKPGGLGVQLMYRVFDEVCFEPGDERGNRVTMRLALEHARGIARRRSGVKERRSKKDR